MFYVPRPLRTVYVDRNSWWNNVVDNDNADYSSQLITERKVVVVVQLKRPTTYAFLNSFSSY